MPGYLLTTVFTPSASRESACEVDFGSCSARLQAGTCSIPRCPPEDGRYTNVSIFLHFARRFLQHRRGLVFLIREAVRDILARVRASTDGDHNVLLAIHHISHWRSALDGRHQDRPHLLASLLVVCP